MRPGFPLQLLLAVAVMTLAACSSDEYADLDQFMAEKRARPGGVIVPIPPFKAYKAFSYSATTMRAPFDRPIEIAELRKIEFQSSVKPDTERAKEFLEQFTFDSLSMVGSLSRSGVDWTLVQDPEGGVHRVRVGNYLGRNHGRVIEMTQSYIAVIEIVSDGSDEGWVERPRTIKLNGI